MKKLLYIGHSYHNKTKSSLFIQELYKEKYEVEFFNYDPDNDDPATHFAPLKGKKCDLLVLFQTMVPSRFIFENVSFKKGVLFPMYDAAPRRDNPIWKEYKDFNIISFSKTLYEELKQMGLSTFYIQYFPKPREISNWGDEKSLFFWQRVTNININTVNKLFKKYPLNHIQLHKVLDPRHTFVEPPKNQKNISYSTWFPNKEDLLKEIQKAAFYIAPREYEGIGMSFLDAMAEGRCVIALNNPTMNEYITDGVTGYLYSLNHTPALEIKNIRQIQKNTIDYITAGYQKWEKEKRKIFEWSEAPVVINKKALNAHQFGPERSLNFGAKQTIQVSLFNFIPFLSIKISPKKTRIKLFKFFPLLKIKKTSKKTVYYLFFFIPLLRIRKK